MTGCSRKAVAKFCILTVWEFVTGVSFSSHRQERRRKLAWMALIETILEKCADIDKEAGKRVLWSIEPRGAFLVIQKQDGAKLLAQYIPQMNSVIFSSNAYPFADRTYELTVRTIEGNETAVWLDTSNSKIESADEIARTVISDFLLTNQL